RGTNDMSDLLVDVSGGHRPEGRDTAVPHGGTSPGLLPTSRRSFRHKSPGSSPLCCPPPFRTTTRRRFGEPPPPVQLAAPIHVRSLAGNQRAPWQGISRHRVLSPSSGGTLVSPGDEAQARIPA